MTKIGKPVTYVVGSKNVKIGRADATYSPIKQTCPSSCPLKDIGCYAKLSHVGRINNQLEKSAGNLTSIELAKEEASAIDNSYKGGAIQNKYFRLHVSGDCKDRESATVLSEAITRWKKRGGNKAWSYTHSWKEIPRSAWGEISILASVSSLREGVAALKKRYAPAIIVDHFESPKAFYMPGSNIKWIPCPAQTHSDVTCEKCKLCFNAKKLAKQYSGIAFEAHGVRAKSLKKHLPILNSSR